MRFPALVSREHALSNGYRLLLKTLFFDPEIQGQMQKSSFYGWKFFKKTAVKSETVAGQLKFGVRSKEHPFLYRMQETATF